MENLLKYLDSTVNLSTIEDFKNYLSKFKNIKRWVLASDYCLNDKDKPNSVISFTLFPVYYKDSITVSEKNTYNAKEWIDTINSFQHSDIKNTKNINDDFIKLMSSDLFFTFNIILEPSPPYIFKNKESVIHFTKSLIDLVNKWISENKSFSETDNKLKENLNLLSHEMNKKSFNYNLTGYLFTIIFFASYIKAILLREHGEIEKFFWVSDRDNITQFLNNDLFSSLYQIISYTLSYKYAKDINDKCENMLSSNQNGDFDTFVRIPDFICGTIASFNYEENSKPDKDKHHKMMKDIIIENKNIIMIRMKSVKEKPCEFDRMLFSNLLKVNNIL